MPAFRGAAGVPQQNSQELLVSINRMSHRTAHQVHINRLIVVRIPITGVDMRTELGLRGVNLIHILVGMSAANLPPQLQCWEKPLN
jgi:hypothetical protein